MARKKTARSVRTQTRAAQEIAKAMFSAPKRQFNEIDGCINRVENKEFPVDRAEVAEFLKYRRGFGYEEVLEAVGAGWLKAMLERGYVVPHLPNFPKTGYIVTEKAVETYKLPRTDAEGHPLKFARAA